MPLKKQENIKNTNSLRRTKPQINSIKCEFPTQIGGVLGKCVNKIPRIGKSFQINPNNIPKYTNDKEVKEKDFLMKKHEIGTLLWIPNKIPYGYVEYFLNFVKLLFNKNQETHKYHHFSVERSLYFLHKCEYDIEKAISYLSIKEISQKEKKEFDIDQENYEEEDFCFVCNDGGSLLLCDVAGCRKVFHLDCAKISSVPEGEWHCPTHFCVVCQKNSDINYQCSYCPQAYCKDDMPLSLKEAEQECEFLCLECHQQNLTPKKRFLHRLNDLMRRRHEIIKIPKISGKELDLFALYKSVIKIGGARRVTDSMMWSRIKEMLKLPEGATNGASLLKSIYIKILYPYEQLFYPRSLSLDDLSMRKRGRPKIKKKVFREAKKNDICDVLITGSNQHALTLEINVNGLIKNGLVFIPQINSSKSIENNYTNDKISDLRVNIKLALEKLNLSVDLLSTQIGFSAEKIACFLFKNRENFSLDESEELNVKLTEWFNSQDKSLLDDIYQEKEKDSFLNKNHNNINGTTMLLNNKENNVNKRKTIKDEENKKNEIELRKKRKE